MEGSLWDNLFPKNNSVENIDNLNNQMLAFRDRMLETGLSADSLAEQYENLDSRILNYANSTDTSSMSVKGFTNFLDKQTFSAKAGQIALQGLAMAGNMIAMWAISKVIEIAIQAIDNYVNAWEHATETIEEHSSAYEEAVSEIETVSSKIEDLDLQIAELNGLDPITNADDITNLELERKILEAQLELLKEKRDLEQEEANKAAEDYFNTKQKSKISEGVSTTLEPTGDYTIDTLAPLGSAISSYMSTEDVTPEEELQNAINKIKEYKQEIEGLNSKEDAQEIADLEAKIVAVQTDANTLASTMLKNSGSLTDASRKEKIVGLVTEYNNLTDSVNGYTDALNENSSAQDENANKTGNLSFKEQLSGVESLSEGLEQLSDIYKDVQDGGDFDWSSILNNDDFKETFKDCTETYDEFIKTISNSPDDIEACQEAFNKLTTEYIRTSDKLKNVTEETRKSTIAFLEQNNVVNAEGLVDYYIGLNDINYETEELTNAKRALGYETKALSDLTVEEIQRLLDEGTLSDYARARLFSLYLTKIQLNNNPVDTSASINNLLGLVGSASAAGTALTKLADIMVKLASVESKLKTDPQNLDLLKQAALLKREAARIKQEAERTSSYFVIEGTEGLSFGWEIKAIQKEYDTMRLEEFQKSETDNTTDVLTETSEYLNSLLYNVESEEF